MILADTPNYVDTWGKSSEDVRRSLDVLDKVLSEFDDIDPSSGDERHSDILSEPKIKNPTPSPSPPEEKPPPIDRSLKPKISPPTLPKKNRKSSLPVDQKVQDPHHEPYPDSQSSHSNTQSSKKSGSDVSSHEYQEINSDLLGPVKKNSNQRPSREDRVSEWSDAASRNLHARHRSQEPPPKPGSSQFREGGTNPSSPCGQLRKSRSGEVSLNDDVRGRKHGRRQAPRRSRSSDRLLDPRVCPPSFPLPPLGPHFDPRMINPSLMDPRLMGPRFYDPRMADPRLLNARLPFHPKEFLPMPTPKYIPESHFPLEGSRHAFDDSVHFPHLLNIHQPPSVTQLPSKPITPTVPLGGLEYPLNMPPYDFPFMQDPPLIPEQLAALSYPVPMEPRLEGYDPRMLSFIPEYPMDMPVNYGHDLPMEYPPRERLDFGVRGGLRNWESRILDGPPVNHGWLPPSAEEARKSIERIVRKQNLCGAEEDAISGGADLRNESSLQQRYSKRSSTKGPQTSTAHSDSSGRASPIEDLSVMHQRIGVRSRHDFQEQEAMVHGRGYNAGTVPGTKPSGAFRVGGAVRGRAEHLRVSPGKEVMSLPHFASGGKDSGFDEGPLQEDVAATKNARISNAPSGGGGFIVSGVFNDSSKMYIPCPPSPTPDYDEDPGDMDDDEESDILQTDIYTMSEQKKNESLHKDLVKPTASNASVESKGTSSSNRDSLSEDSLQDGKTSNKKVKTLEAMMTEFHLGLPPPNHEIEGSYSDDSLEESSFTSPSGPSTMDLRNQRPQSMESLVSMDGSTTSFDYMSGGASKSLSPVKPKLKKKIFQDSKKSPIIKKPQPLPNTNINQHIEDISNSNFFPESCNSAPIPPPVSFDINFPSNNSKAKKKSKKMETRIYGVHCEENLKKENVHSGAKFDTIRNMIKEGLIEGLDDNPPDFKPPPVSEKPLNSTSSEERTDSGMGSTVSTNRTDESGCSDNHSDKSGTPPSSKGPFSLSSPCDRIDNHDIDNSNNNPRSNKNPLEKRHHSPPPPPPPPRDSSMKGTPGSSQGTPRNHSWLHKTKRPAPLPVPKDKTSPPQRTTEAVVDARKERVSRVDNSSYSPGGNNLSQNLYQRSGENRVLNGSVPPLDYKRRITSNIDKQENLKNLESSLSNRPDTLPVISEDQCSVSSHGSRSSRFFSRLSDSMKSGTRSSTTSSKGSNKNTSKHSASSRPSPRIHADIIRNPNRNISKPIISPPDLPSVVSPSTIVPFTRDGSGRFRSIEDLAEESSVNKGSSSHPGGADVVLEQKKKKHATLPPNLNPGSVEEEMKELRRATSLMYGKRHKDENEPSKFKFNIFKGFWRRNKYSFDKT